MKEFMMSERCRNLKSPIRDILGIANKVKAEGKKVYYFNVGDPNKFDFDTPEYLKDALKKAVEGKTGHYSDSNGEPSLIEAITEKENKNGVRITSDKVTVTNGISEGLVFLFNSLLEDGDELLMPGPAYPPYPEMTKFCGGVPITYKTDEENGWQPDIDDIRKKITSRTKALVIINPNNPTGAVFGKKTLQQMVDIAGEAGIPIISDEIYDKLVFGNTVHVPTATIAKDVPIIGLNGFSKTYLIPGWRVGYIYFSGLDDINEGVKAQARQRLSACTPIMMACAAAFKGPQSHISEMNKKLKERAEFAYKKLNEIDGISAVKPEGAFYIFPKVELKKWKDDREFCIDVLKNTGLVLPHGSGFDPVYGKGHFRSVILAPVEVMDEAFTNLQNFILSSS